jgi:hypothetical protein
LGGVALIDLVETFLWSVAPFWWFILFCPSRMQQKVENELNEKEEDPVNTKREPSKWVASRYNYRVDTQFKVDYRQVLVELSPSSH